MKDVARIIYYDQRAGNSSADATGETYTIEQAVEDLESLRKALNFERWVVLGWSYGGLLAQLYSLKYPERCKGLVLGASNTGFSFIKNQEQEQMFLSKEELSAIAYIEKTASEGKITIAQALYNMDLAGNWKYYFYHKPTKEEVIRLALYGFNSAPGFEEQMRPKSYRVGLEGKFDDFAIPTLIAEARWDLGWLEPNRIEIMRKNHPHVQIEVFEKSGRAIYADEPEKFFAVLKKFLGEVGNTTSPVR
jgi:proline iminopeptidase